MLEEKAVDVRKQVFDLITDNEALVKSFKHREAVVKKISDEKKSQNTFTGREGAAKLTQIYQEIIQTNVREWSKSLEVQPTDYENRLEERIVASCRLRRHILSDTRKQYS